MSFPGFHFIQIRKLMESIEDSNGLRETIVIFLLLKFAANNKMKATVVITLILAASMLSAYEMRTDLSGTWIPEGASYATEHIEQKGADVKIETLDSKGKVIS